MSSEVEFHISFTEDEHEQECTYITPIPDLELAIQSFRQLCKALPSQACVTLERVLKERTNGKPLS